MCHASTYLPTDPPTYLSTSLVRNSCPWCLCLLAFVVLCITIAARSQAAKTVGLVTPTWPHVADWVCVFPLLPTYCCGHCTELNCACVQNDRSRGVIGLAKQHKGNKHAACLSVPYDM